MKIKGIIFDLDGTLIDSMKVWEDTDREFLNENGIEYTPEMSQTVKKMTIIQAAEYIKKEYSLEHSCEYIINRIEQMTADKYRYSIPLKDGVYETLTELKNNGIKMCVATATYNSLADAVLKRLGIYDMFEFVLTCSDVGSGKNSPEIFHKAAKKLGTDISETVVIEDSLHCIETAVNAGFFTIALYDSVSENDWKDICRTADISIKNMRELTERNLLCQK